MYSIITVLSVVLAYIYSLTQKAFVKYFVSLVWGVSAVFLYAVYLLAFLGKENNARVFTFDILLAYLRNVKTFAENTGVSPVLIYALVIGIPMVIIITYLASTRVIYGAVNQLRSSVSRFLFDSPPPLLRVFFIIVLFAWGFIAGYIAYNYEGFYKRRLRLEEPLTAVFGGAIQGLDMRIVPESGLVRTNYPKNVKFEKKNIVVVVVDALRADHLSLYGYARKTSPFLDSLYNSGDLKRVNLALSNASGSFPGILSIIRSKSWHNMSDQNFNLPDLLKDQGYDLNFLISGDHTNFYQLKSYYSDGFKFYIDGSTTKDYATNDDRIIFEGLAKIPAYHNKPAYFHVHLNSVHVTGKRLDENKLFMPDQHNREIRAYYINNYDNGIVQADRYIKRLFAELRAKGYLQNSVVVITADHGESVGENNIFGHSHNVYTNHLLIPLLIYDPGNNPYKNLDFATQVDIAPTIVNRLGLPVPKTWEGYSLLNERPDTYTFHQMNNYYAVVHKKGKMLYKYIINKGTKTEELYDLRNDLYEKHNLINIADKAYVDSLRQVRKAFRVKF